MNDATEISQRFAELIEHLKISKSAFAKVLGTSTGRISNIVQGRNRPDSQLLAKISEVYPMVELSWLLNGNGQIERNVSIQGNEQQTNLSRNGDKQSEVDAKNTQVTHRSNTQVDTQVENVNPSPTGNKPTKTAKLNEGPEGHKERANHIRSTVQAQQADEEAASRWYNRRITESRLYKRYPEAEPTILHECLAVSHVGVYSDKILNYLHDKIYSQIDEVFDDIIDKKTTYKAATDQIKQLSAPLEEMREHIDNVEKSIFKMLLAAVQRYPETEQMLVGSPIALDLFEHWEASEEEEAPE